MAVVVGSFTPVGAALGSVEVRMIPEASGVATFGLVSTSNTIFTSTAPSSITLAGAIPSQFRPSSTTRVCSWSNIRTNINEYMAYIAITASGDIIVFKSDGIPDPNWTVSRPYVIDKVLFTVAKI